MKKCNCKIEKCSSCGRDLPTCRLDKRKICAMCAYLMYSDGNYPPIKKVKDL